MDKVALVTGGAVGIGSAISLKLASEGYKLALNCRTEERAKTDGENILDAARQLQTEAECYVCDISDYEATEKMIGEIMERFGRIDVVVNNAGVTKDGLIARMTEEDFDNVIDVNLKGVFNVCRHVSRILIKQRSGKIINVSSVVGVGGNSGQVNYAASKAGVNGLTMTLAKELGSRNITVNAVAPGFIKSRMTENLSERIKKYVLSGIALGRFGNTEEVASLVAFLASDDANYINGQIIRIDGGLLI